jgi:hypothetical protein
LRRDSFWSNQELIHPATASTTLTSNTPQSIKMLFSSALLAAATLAIADAAQFTMSASFFASPIVAGSTVNITWADASGPVTILLKDGLATNLQTVSSIASKLLPKAREWTLLIVLRWIDHNLLPLDPICISSGYHIRF